MKDVEAVVGGESGSGRDVEYAQRDPSSFVVFVTSVLASLVDVLERNVLLVAVVAGRVEDFEEGRRRRGAGTQFHLPESFLNAGAPAPLVIVVVRPHCR